MEKYCKFETWTEVQRQSLYHIILNFEVYDLIFKGYFQVSGVFRMQYEELDLGSSTLQKEKEDSFIMAGWEVLMGCSMDEYKLHHYK